MLSYEICCALKDAGYKGDEYDRYYFATPMGQCCDTLQTAQRHSAVRLANPGMETLINAIQVRWPTVSIEITVSGSITLVDAWNPDVPMLETASELASPAQPVEALAALYLALVEATPNAS